MGGRGSQGSGFLVLYVCVCGVCGGVNVCAWVCMMWLREQSVRIADVLTPRGLLLIEREREKAREAVSRVKRR